MRRVIIYERKYLNTPGGGFITELVQTGAGVFHQFGCAFEEFEAGPGNYTTAVIEMTDGTVVTPGADLIKFIDDESGQ